MKAILVFDVDNIDIKSTQATYIELQCNNLTIQMALLNHWLKPMPQKLDMSKREFEIGWNACIDELLGEKE